MFGEMRDMKRRNIEQYLDTNHSDWRTYEDQMMENLQAHPTFVNDPDLLYRVSVPSDVLEARANQRALDKIQGTTSNRTQGQSTTTQQSTGKPKKAMTFNEAVEHAKGELKRQGIAPPSVE